MSAKKRRPEFELAPIIIAAVQEYLGVRAVNKLSSHNASAIASHCQDCAREIGLILEEDPDDEAGE